VNGRILSKTLAMLAALGLPLVASSAQAALSTEDGALTSLIAWQTVVDVWFTPTHACGDDPHKFTLRASIPNYAQMHAQLLAALLAGKDVKLWYTCDGSLAVVAGVQIKR
jgi:hypothetical protein